MFDVESKNLAGDLHSKVVVLSQNVSWQFVLPNLNTAVCEYGVCSRGALTVTTKDPVVADGRSNNGIKPPV
jgi:hypothetical protein